MSVPLFAAEDLTCLRGGIPVVSGVTLSVRAGEVLILSGANGSGKTTLLRTCAGLQPAAAGRMEGTENCAYASHLDGVKAALTVTENLTFWASVFDRPLASPVLHDFDLHGLRDRLAGTLSAGQSRRLGLARLALTGRPVWLMDEPTVSLDAASVGLFAAAVRRHCADGGAAIIASHIDLTLTDGGTVEVLEMARFAPDTDQRTTDPGAFDAEFL